MHFTMYCSPALDSSMGKLVTTSDQTNEVIGTLGLGQQHWLATQFRLSQSQPKSPIVATTEHALCSMQVETERETKELMDGLPVKTHKTQLVSKVTLSEFFSGSCPYLSS